MLLNAYMDIGEREEVGIWCYEDSLQVGPQMTRAGSQDQSALPFVLFSSTQLQPPLGVGDVQIS